MKTTLTFATAIGACLLLGACNKQSSDKTAVQGGESAVAESAKSARINANLRFEADVNLNLAPLLSGVSNGAFNPLDDVANKTINPPVHARGAINSLKLDGKDVLLASKELKEGFLFTKVFGELEVFVTGIRGGQAVLEYRAFPDDIEKIKKAYPNQERDATDKAMGELRAKAEKGDALAQYELGVRFTTGSNVPQDDAAAAKWYRKAAEQGYADAQYSMASIAVTENDFVECYKWMVLAAGQGNQSAKNFIADVAAGQTRLTPEQIAEGQKRATNFKPTKQTQP